MEMFVVRGGRPLRGTVAVGGAKNAALPILAASLMADGPLVLHNVPRLVDVATMVQLLRTLGAEVHVSRIGDPAAPLRVEMVDESRCVAPYELVRRMRAGVCVLGPLLARRGRACVSLPGGCNIGNRPIDLHLQGLRTLGANIRIDRGYVFAEAGRLRGARIPLRGARGSSVTATCNVMCAAVLAEGKTVIDSAACEPEVVDLGECLNRMGADIVGLGTPQLVIRGVARLEGIEHTIIPDRIEAATLMIAAALTRGDVRIENARADHLTAVIQTLREAGVRIETQNCASRIADWVSGELRVESQDTGDSGDHSPLATHHLPQPQSCRVCCPRRPRAVDVAAVPYPGVPTDVQAQLVALLATAEGKSVVSDRVFPDRFMHVAELNRMGARIRRFGATAVVSGVERLSGAGVMASDLRASAALVLAALAAEGPSVVRRIYHLDRGYESLESKLTALGADVRRVEDVPANLPAELAAAEVPPAAHWPPAGILRRAS